MYLHSGPTPRGREDPSFEAAASAVIEQVDATPNNTSHWVFEFTMMAAFTQLVFPGLFSQCLNEHQAWGKQKANTAGCLDERHN
jgi:hypothetical protein